MNAIELSAGQREQMAGLIGQLNTTRTVAEAFVGYFAKELGINLQLYQFNADSLAFEPVQGFMPPQATADNGLLTNSPEPAVSSQQSAVHSENGRIEAI